MADLMIVCGGKEIEAVFRGLRKWLRASWHPPLMATQRPWSM